MCIRVKLLVALGLVVLLAGCVTTNDGSSNIKQIFAKRSEAELLYQRGDYAEVLPIYLELSRLVPGHAETWLRLGNSYARLSQYDNAIDAYQGALSADPQYAKAWLNLSYVRAQQLAATVVDMYEHVPTSDPEARRIYSLVEDVLVPFGESLTQQLPDIDAEHEGEGGRAREPEPAQPVLTETQEIQEAQETEIDVDSSAP